jgi:phage regulator Rha-like protein
MQEKLIAKFEEMKKEEDSIKEILKNKIPKIKEMSQKAKTYLAEIFKTSSSRWLSPIEATENEKKILKGSPLLEGSDIQRTRNDEV